MAFVDDVDFVDVVDFVDRVDSSLVKVIRRVCLRTNH
jgi:hypothetical protein